MMPRKNVGGPKGKGPAKKTPAKCPLPPRESSSEEEDVSAEELNALMARMDKFERERGLSMREAGPRPARQASRKIIFKNLLSRMSVLEAARAAATQEVDHNSQPEPNQREQDPPAPTPQTVVGQVSADNPATTTLTSAAPAVSWSQPVSAEVQPAKKASPSATTPADPVMTSPSASPAVPERAAPGQPATQAIVVDGPSTSAGNNTTLVWPWGLCHAQNTTPTLPSPALVATGASVAKAGPQVPTVAPITLEMARTGDDNQYWGTDKWVLPIVPTAASASLGAHLSQKTIDKILRNEYIDMFSLYFRELDKKEKEDLDEERKEKLKNRRVERNWKNWIACYTIYASLLVEAHPYRAKALFKYQNIIYGAYVNYTGQVWLVYDSRFRSEAATMPNKRWDLIDSQLWMEVMNTTRAVSGEKADSGHTIQNTKESQPFRQGGPAQQPQRQKAMCWEYAAQGACAREDCKYQHACAICQGNHATNSCYKGKPTRSGPRGAQFNRRNPGQVTVPKGPQPNQGGSA
ncbi:uncharacterized protein [Anolis sagrei]|uniref:uncharacterized protein n=1 Tax=Anolis sagrei TaxID=38937 RepID=UPI0035221829